MGNNNIKNGIMEIAEITVSAVLITLAGLITGEIVAGIAVSAVLHLISGSLYPALNEDIISYITSNFAFIMIIILLALYVKIFKKKKLEDIYYFKGNNKKIMPIAGGLTGFVLCAASISVPVIKGDIVLQYNKFDIIIYLLVFLSCCVQASAEEIVFRGYIYGRARQAYTEGVAIILNSVLFSLTHLNNSGIDLNGIINIILVGILFSYMYNMAKSLSFVCGVHIMWNFTEEILSGLPGSGITFGMPLFSLIQSRQTLFYNEKFGIEASLQTTFIYIILLIAVFIYKRRKKL